MFDADDLHDAELLTFVVPSAPIELLAEKIAMVREEYARDTVRPSLERFVPQLDSMLALIGMVRPPYPEDGKAF
jgi:hypothetical protein